jgi:hypothetical protein
MRTHHFINTEEDPVVHTLFFAMLLQSAFRHDRARCQQLVCYTNKRRTPQHSMMNSLNQLALVANRHEIKVSAEHGILSSQNPL